jgi:serine phosphatase RsbU (regulator of sigma subunit)
MPPLVVNASGDSRALNLTGPAVGAIRDADFVVLEDTLRPGELLFSYTDGLTDAENVHGEHFTPARLLPLLTKGVSPAALLEIIHANLNEFTLGAAQFDDIAMLAVSRTGG